MHDNLSHSTPDDLPLLGLLPDQPAPDLNLAGVEGVPSPEVIARPAAQVEINAPTFSAPDMRIPTLAAHDLTTPGIDLRPPFAPDPALPALLDYEHPLGLAIQPASPTAPDPSIADLLLYDRPAELAMTHDVTEPDPLVPDLQQPELTQQRQMPARPGDLDPTALDVMHAQATYQQLDGKTYPAVFMDGSGVNTTRSRHMDLLMRGLDTREER